MKITNVLDDKLDWNSLELQSYSHENNVLITNGNQIEFMFDAIYLPDTTSDEKILMVTSLIN